MSDDKNVNSGAAPSETPIGVDVIIQATVDAFNARKFQSVPLSKTIQAEHLTAAPSSPYATTQPYSHYRKSAIFLAGFAGHAAADLAAAFNSAVSDIERMQQYAERTLKSTPAVSQIFHTLVQKLDFPLQRLPEALLPQKPEKKPELVEKPMPKRSAEEDVPQLPAIANTSAAKLAPMTPRTNSKPVQKPSARSPFAQNVTGSADTKATKPIRPLTIGEVADAALKSYNHIFEERITGEQLIGTLLQGDTGHNARRYVIYAIYQCIPSSSCTSADVVRHFRDPQANRGTYDHVRRLMGQGDLKTRTYLDDLADRLELSFFQKQYLRSSDMGRPINWANLRLLNARYVASAPRKDLG